jgi:hypothetical protein
MFILRLIIIFLLTTFSLNIYALDQMAKEETTPPPAEGALTAEQIPPINSADKGVTVKAPDNPNNPS